MCELSAIWHTSNGHVPKASNGRELAPMKRSVPYHSLMRYLKRGSPQSAIRGWLSITQPPCTMHQRGCRGWKPPDMTPIPFPANMSESKTSECVDVSEDSVGDPCDEKEPLSEDEDSDLSDDFLASDEDDEVADLFPSDVGGLRLSIAECDGPQVPRAHLETLAQITSVCHASLLATTHPSFLVCSKEILSVLVSRGTLKMTVSPPAGSTFLEQVEMSVLSPRLLCLLRQEASPPSHIRCPTTSLSALVTFIASMETILTSTGSIELSLSPSPSPLDKLLTRLTLALVLVGPLARKVLKSS